MMYVIVPINRRDVEVTWHIGERLNIPHDDMPYVKEVQADGDELRYLQRKMVNIPFAVDKAVNRWFGDDAKFIAANL